MESGGVAEVLLGRRGEECGYLLFYVLGNWSPGMDFSVIDGFAYGCMRLRSVYS